MSDWWDVLDHAILGLTCHGMPLQSIVTYSRKDYEKPNGQPTYQRSAARIFCLIILSDGAEIDAECQCGIDFEGVGYFLKCVVVFYERLVYLAVVGVEFRFAFKLHTQFA